MSEFAYSPGGSVIAKLFDQILVADTATVDTLANGIPQGYAHLWILAQILGTTTGQPVRMRFNGDSGANYEWGNIFTSGTNAASGSTGTADSSGEIGFMGSSATDPAAINLIIPNYAGTSLQKTYASCTYYHNPGNASYAGHWASTAAINQIQFLMGSGSIKTGSRITIYGLP